jgi:hypothetical protein
VEYISCCGMYQLWNVSVVKCIGCRGIYQLWNISVVVECISCGLYQLSWNVLVVVEYISCCGMYQLWNVSVVVECISCCGMYQLWNLSVVECISCCGMYPSGHIPRQLATLDWSQSVHSHNTDIAWVAYKAPTTPWRWQPLAETCRGKIWNTLIKSTSSLTRLLVISQRYCKLLGPVIKKMLRKIFGPLNIDSIWRMWNNMEIDELIESADTDRNTKA